MLDHGWGLRLETWDHERILDLAEANKEAMTLCLDEGGNGEISCMAIRPLQHFFLAHACQLSHVTQLQEPHSTYGHFRAFRPLGTRLDDLLAQVTQVTLRLRPK